MAKDLLIIAHCPSPNTSAMAQSVFKGACSVVTDPTHVELASPFDCDAERVLKADALILFTTENFGYMSGALKDWFERIYYPCLDDEKRNQAKPYALIIKAGQDGIGTEVSVRKIITGLKWKEAAPVLLCKGKFREEFIEQCNELGQTMAASLEAELI